MANAAGDVESLRMLVQIVETHSTERAEQRAELLIDLLNSDEGREYIDEKVDTSKRLITEKLVRLVLLMSKKLYDLIASLYFKSTSELISSLQQRSTYAVPREVDEIVLELLNKKFLDDCAAAGVRPRSARASASYVKPDLDVIIDRMVESRMGYSQQRSFGIVEQLLFELANTKFNDSAFAVTPNFQSWLLSRDLKPIEVQRHLHSAMFFQALQCMAEIRQLISGNRWINADSAPFSPSTIHFVLAKASGVLDNESLSGNDKMCQLWNGVAQNISEIDGDVGRARANLEKFLEEQREYNDKMKNRISSDEIIRRQQKVRDDFEKSLHMREERVEKYLQSVHEHVRHLESQLTGLVNRGMALVSQADIMQQLLLPPETANAGERFTRRRSTPNWFAQTEEFLFDYIRGRKTDYELKQFLIHEELYADLSQISQNLTSWINETYKSIDKMELPMLNKEGIIAEIKRTWVFTKALLLNDADDVRLHSELLQKTINATCSTNDNSKVSPVISMGSLRLNDDELALKFVTGTGANVTKIEAFVRHTVEIAGGSIHNVFHYTRNREIVFTIKFAEGYDEGSVRKCVQHIVSNLSELAELHVCIAMLGNYDITSGTMLTNPAFNRIYGNGLSASGFQSSFHLPRDYGGEMYYCPVGWRRISLNVARSAAEFDQKYQGWHVAYHGTKHELAATILTSGFVAGPEANSEKNDIICVTPSIVYASNPRYSEVYEVKDNGGNKTYVQMVLQLRVNPAYILERRSGVTLFGDNQSPTEAAVDPNFLNNKNLEWLVKPTPGMTGVAMFRNSFVVYGIMIRDSKTDPRTHPENAWWANVKDE